MIDKHCHKVALKFLYDCKPELFATLQKESMAARVAPAAARERAPDTIAISRLVEPIYPLSGKSDPLVLLIPTIALPGAIIILSSPLVVGATG